MSEDRDQDESAALWLSYSASRDAALRERLVLRYLPFARMLAAKMYAARTHQQVEFDDYLQFARTGLLEALDRFDPGRGYKFETYAASRINGAILNGMQNYSEVHEQVAARKRIVQARLATLQQPAADIEKPAALFDYLAELAVGLAVGFVLDDTGMYQQAEPEAPYRDSTYAGIELKQLSARIAYLLEQLPEQQRRVIRYHYIQQYPFEEIAELMLLSRGRISQLHKEALSRLRQAAMSMPDLDWSG